LIQDVDQTAHQRSPEEKADYMTLRALYEAKAQGLAAEIQLAVSGFPYRDPDGEPSPVLRSIFEEIKGWRAEAAQWQTVYDAVTQRIAARTEAAARVTSSPDSDDLSAGELLIWKGTQREFVDWIAGAWDKGKIEASSARQAVMNAARQFVILNKKTGRKEPLDGKTAWQSWRNKKDEELP
jgi:hypothetical protein